MINWTEQELTKINNADDLKIAPYHADFATTGTPTWIWAVVVEHQIYVRAYSGVASRWYKSARQQKKGEIIAAGQKYNVTFEPIKDAEILDKIDLAYNNKYAKSRYVGHMVGITAKAATVRINKAL